MVLTPIRKIRKSELQKAAFDVLFSNGYQSTTVEQVAERAGIAKGAVHHYFANKGQLLHYAVRYGHSLYRRAVVRRLAGKTSPSERLWATIDGNFASEIFQPQLCRAWLSVFDASFGDPLLRRLFEIVDLRTISTLTHDLKRLGPAANARDIARDIMGMIDGLWCLAASHPELTREHALSFMLKYVGETVPGFDAAPEAIPRNADAER
jgi:TetR/AcrR family transcriptional regulator, transcriptional repressor of bet genes